MVMGPGTRSGGALLHSAGWRRDSSRSVFTLPISPSIVRKQHLVIHSRSPAKSPRSRLVETGRHPDAARRRGQSGLAGQGQGRVRRPGRPSPVEQEATMVTKAEQETVIRWDREQRIVQLYTADPAQARRWVQLGYDVKVQGTDRDGRPHGWTATGPSGCVRFRRLRNGAVVKRVNGRQNLPVHQRVLSPSLLARVSRRVRTRGESDGEYGQSQTRRPWSPQGVEEPDDEGAHAAPAGREVLQQRRVPGSAAPGHASSGAGRRTSRATSSSGSMGSPLKSVALTGEAKKPIRVTIEVVRNKPLPVPAAPDTPALPGQLRRLPFRAGDGNLGAQAPIDVGLTDERYRAR